MPSTTTEAVDRGDVRSKPAPYFAWLFLKPWGLRDDALDDAALAGVLADEHDDSVPGPDLRDLRCADGRPVVNGHHSTSGASDTIFM